MVNCAAAEEEVVERVRWPDWVPLTISISLKPFVMMRMSSMADVFDSGGIKSHRSRRALTAFSRLSV